MKNNLICFFLTMTIAFILSCQSDNDSIADNEINQNSVAYTNIDIIDGISTMILKDQTIIINKTTGEILDLYRTKSKTPNENIKIKNMQGKTMIPGLIEGHFHLASTIGEQTNLGEKSLKNMFRQGITVVRDMAGNGTALLNLQQMSSDKNRAYPKVYFSAIIVGKDFLENDPRVNDTAGNGIAGEEPWFAVLDDDTDVALLVSNAKNFGCQALKLYADISPENIRRVIAEAEAQNFPVWSHGTVFNASPWDVVNSHSISHADLLNYVTEPVPTLLEFYDEDYSEVFNLSTISSIQMKDYFNSLKQNNTVFDVTLSVYTSAGTDDEDVRNFANSITEAAYEIGVKIGLGVDAFNDDIGKNDYLLLQEMKLLIQKAGMTNMDVIKAATIHNAIAIGIDDEYGTIEIGKKADLVILNNNPLEDIKNVKSVEIVIKDGLEHIIN